MVAAIRRTGYDEGDVVSLFVTQNVEEKAKGKLKRRWGASEKRANREKERERVGGRGRETRKVEMKQGT